MCASSWLIFSIQGHSCLLFSTDHHDGADEAEQREQGREDLGEGERERHERHLRAGTDGEGVTPGLKIAINSTPTHFFGTTGSRYPIECQKVSYTLYIVSKSVIYALYSVKKCLIHHARTEVKLIHSINCYFQSWCFSLQLLTVLEEWKGARADTSWSQTGENVEGLGHGFRHGSPCLSVLHCERRWVTAPFAQRRTVALKPCLFGRPTIEPPGSSGSAHLGSGEAVEDFFIPEA